MSLWTFATTPGVEPTNNAAERALPTYDVFVSVNGGPFTAWLTDTALNQATYTGVEGNTYRFYSMATDRVGNRQSLPTAAQATTQLPASPPTISDVTDRTVTFNGSTGAIAFTVGDNYTAATGLVVTVTSSNLTFVPFAGLVVGGIGANRTITITPLENPQVHPC